MCGYVVGLQLNFFVFILRFYQSFADFSVIPKSLSKKNYYQRFANSLIRCSILLKHYLLIQCRAKC